MYTLVSALGKPLVTGGRWSEIAIGDTPLIEVFASYAKVYLVLSNSFFDHNVSLDLEYFRSQYAGLSTTINQVLAGLGTNSLPTSDTVPSLDAQYVKYADAFHAGYKITPVDPLAAPDAALPMSQKTALYLTRDNTDYDLAYQSLLAVVNGFVHRTDTNHQGLYVIDGMSTCRDSKRNEIGLLSFRELGALSFVTITGNMVYKQDPAQRFRDRTYIDLGQDVSNKTVMLVLGGYLHVLDQKTFYRVGKSMVAIDFNNLPLFDRYFESREIIDLSALPIERTDRNASQIGVDDFLSDANLLAYLMLSQSFFVILDNPDIFAEFQYLHESKMPGMYVSVTEPIYPMVNGRGKLVPYWYTYEDGQFSVTCTDGVIYNRLFHSFDPTKANSISDACNPQRPFDISRGMYLMIGKDL